MFEPEITNIQILIITLSDRASRGEYEDKSGALIVDLLNDFFSQLSWKYSITREIIPDDPEQLHNLLQNAKNQTIDIVITTGGTGLGPKDFTPDVVAAIIDKEIPGIMEHIRLKFGQINPNALLSRSVAGLAGKTLIYALPGSPKAVAEYVPEILRTLEHLIYMVHKIDVH